MIKSGEVGRLRAWAIGVVPGATLTFDETPAAPGVWGTCDVCLEVVPRGRLEGIGRDEHGQASALWCEACVRRADDELLDWGAP